MKWRKFDKKVNDELDNHQSEVDINAIWAAIEPDVDAINAEKKKRRRGLFWWFFAGILLASVGLGTLFFNGSKGEESTDLTTKKVVTEIDEVINFAEKDKEISEKEAIRDTGAEETIADFNKNREKTERSTTKNKGIASANTLRNQKIRRETANNRAETKNSNSFANSSSDDIKSELKNNEAINIAVAKTADTSLEKRIENNLEKQATSSAALNEKSEINSVAPPVDSLQNMVVTDVELSKNTMNEAVEPTIENEVETALEKEADSDENRKQKPVQAAISIYGGAGFSNRDLQGKMDSLGNNLAQLRGSTESNLETVQLGLQLHLQHEKTGLELITGLNYTQINERFDYNTAVVEVDSIEGVEFVFRNVNGDTVETIGMLPRTTTTTFTNRHYNKYRLIDVPILLGYRKQFGKFSVGAQAGIFVNLRLKASGRMLQSDTEIVDFDEVDIYKNSVGLSYYFGATLDYEFTSNWSISAAPFVRQLPNNFAKDSYGLEQKYTLLGLNLGLRYSF